MIIPPAPYSYTGEVTTVDVPTLSGSYTYNGESQTPVWTNYDENAISIFGQTSGVNAGEYEVTFSLNSKRAYKWSDGTTSDKTGTWSISKANNVILFIPDYIPLTYYNRDSSTTVVYHGDGELTYYVQHDFATATRNSDNSGLDGYDESWSQVKLDLHAIKTGTSYLHVDISEGTNYFSKSGYISIDVDMSKLFNVTINSNDDTMGTVTGGGNVKEGNSVTVTATPNNNYKFVSWKSNGEVVSNSTSYTFTPTENIELTAIFEEIPIYTVTIIVDPVNSGTVTGGGQHREGVEVVINHTATEGYRFVGLKENGVTISTGKNYVFNITSDKTFTAVFEEIPVYTVTATIDPEDAGTVTGTGQYREGELCTLVATVAQGYQFSGWQRNGITVNTNESFSFTVTENTDFTAMFSVFSRLPAGYTELEYIKSDSHSYIQTDIVANFSTRRIVMDIEAGNYVSNELIMYAPISGSYYFFLMRTSNTIIMSRFAGNAGVTRTVNIANKRITIDWDFPNNKLIIGDSTFTPGTSTRTIGTKIQIFGEPSIVAKLYSAQIYTSNTLDADYVPCTNPSGTVGVYDLVGEKFYANAGTGTFTAGPSI